MENEIMEKLFSKQRLTTYYNIFLNDKAKAIEYYQLNTLIAKSFYPLLLNLEVSLRNSIHQSFSIKFQTENWLELIEYPELVDQINLIKAKIVKNRQTYSIDKLISELTFGFWTTLFNKQYAKTFWKPLMYTFKNIETEDKQRDKIAFRLNQVRKFRNRIFHYEPICNDLDALRLNYDNIIEILNWIDKDLAKWTISNGNFEILYLKAKQMR